MQHLCHSTEHNTMPCRSMCFRRVECAVTMTVVSASNDVRPTPCCCWGPFCPSKKSKYISHRTTERSDSRDFSGLISPNKCINERLPHALPRVESKNLTNNLLIFSKITERKSVKGTNSRQRKFELCNIARPCQQ